MLRLLSSFFVLLIAATVGAVEAYADSIAKHCDDNNGVTFEDRRE